MEFLNKTYQKIKKPLKENGFKLKKKDKYFFSFKREIEPLKKYLTFTINKEYGKYCLAIWLSEEVEYKYFHQIEKERLIQEIDKAFLESNF